MHYNGNNYMIMQRPATWGNIKDYIKSKNTLFFLNSITLKRKPSLLEVYRKL